MPQLEFKNPDFLDHNRAEEIHARMMANLPEDIDNMPGGFPYDFTKPAALEKDEFINYHMARALMIAFPQFAWDEWLDLHGQQVHVKRHEPEAASGKVLVTGKCGTIIPAGTIFCTPATDSTPALEFSTDKNAIIEENETVSIAITAVTAGKISNVAANTICLMAKPNKNIVSITNEEPMRGGTERETNDDYYDRIFAEYNSSMTFLGNDGDYVRWAKEAGAGDCIVVSTSDGSGTVKLVLVDGNGQPANEKLIQDVYQHIVSPDDRTKRLLPTACTKLICVAATTIKISYTCTGLLLEETADLNQIKEEFKKAILTVYDEAKNSNILRYNQVRPLLSTLHGVKDFEEFRINGGTENIILQQEEYPETGTLIFTIGSSET